MTDIIVKKNSFAKRILNFFLWCLKSFLIGIVLVFVFNFIGSYINLHIPINIWTVLIISLFKLPGLAAIVIFGNL